ncbi:MAG: hypothetical protein GX259_08585 [Bacteroidales bacterium]|nr:hypothetical protein [Bacteroidales bacterium]
MKKIFIIFAALLMTASMFLPQQVSAQAPEKMSYQAVIRNSSDELVKNTQIGMQISILQGSANGTTVYVETQTPTTNINGLVSIEIGAGTVVSGDFATIDWKNGAYFIKTETDPSGGTNYSITVTNQLLSVPYALHAKTAETITGEVVETDPVFTAWDKSEGISITENQISDLGNYIENETDPNFTSWDKSTGISITESQITDLGNYITTETDPVFGASVASGISGADTANWNNKLGSFTEIDPVFTAWDKSEGISITESQISDFGTYLTTETDPLFGASVASGITGADTANWNNKLDNFIEADPVISEKFDFTGAADGDLLRFNGEKWVKVTPNYLTEEVQTLADVIAKGNSANSQIKSVTDPTEAQDAATKAYIDTKDAATNANVNTLLERLEVLEELAFGFIDERDNNHYRVVRIGNQTWMAENLRYLPSVVGPTTGGGYAYYYVYGYNGTDTAVAKATDNYKTYGVLYNWPAAMNYAASSETNPSGVQGVCPCGWHLPSDAEWQQLLNYLGGDSIAGGKLKEMDTLHWAAPNFGATNVAGFTALPAGIRSITEENFKHIKLRGRWWSATRYPENEIDAWGRSIYSHTNGEAHRSRSNKTSGFSVRCVKD